MDGPGWTDMRTRPRIAMTALRKADLPADLPGVYAVHRDGKPVYVGLAEKQSLQGRFWNSHRGRGVNMTGSALRRNVAAHLGIASSADIKARRYKPSPNDAARVNAWVDGCEVSWIACETPAQAKRLEDDLKAEWTPFLTKQ